jgi:2-dehydropantoate 2-reductase
VLVDEITGARETSRVQVVDALRPEDQYDLVIVLIRKNRLPPVLGTLAANAHLKNILFMGNNALGFECYLDVLPEEKVLFGFPGAGGGVRDHVVHFADREKPGGKRKAVTIGEVDGGMRERTRAIKSLFEESGIPVDATTDIDGVTTDIDGWLKYHVALVSPLVNALYKHGCDNYALARDKKTLQAMVRAAKEGGRVLKALGYSVKALQGLLGSKFAEIAFSLHARAAQDEMRELADEFRSLIERTSIETPNIDLLRDYIDEYEAA